MAEQEREDRTKVFDKLSGTQKSAILMMLLGEDEASEILKNLSPKEVQHLGSAMYSVEGLDQDTVNKVLDAQKPIPICIILEGSVCLLLDCCMV